jgi:prepilin-type N-terminal cleavage/methylation domain-containing protein
MRFRRGDVGLRRLGRRGHGVKTFAATPLGLANLSHLPRVACSSQPWAGMRNPVGIEHLARRARRLEGWNIFDRRDTLAAENSVGIAANKMIPAGWTSTAFTLIELLVVLAVIGLLAALLLPTLGRAKESSKGVACLSNLHQAGVALQMYVQDNNNKLPFMSDQVPGTNNPFPGPDTVLSNSLGNVNVLRCPSDHNAQFGFEGTHSSYAWNSLLNGEDADHLQAFGLEFKPHEIPVMYDKEKFHIARGPAKAQNWLYADGHIKNLLAIEGSIQSTH